MRLDGLGTSLLLASSSPAFGLAVRSCSYSRTFACCFFQPGPHGIGLAVQLPLPPSVRSGSFHPDSSCPCRAHERRVHAAETAELRRLLPDKSVTMQLNRRSLTQSPQRSLRKRGRLLL